VSRAALRAVLGACLGEQPRRLTLLEEGGKPRLADAPGRELDFSLSHSGGLALLAVARRLRVGIDLERLRAARFLEEVAERFFSEEERGELEPLRGGARRRAWFRLWTRREAAAKAQGLGILEHLGRFPDWSAARQEAEGWQVVDLLPARGYAGALCLEGRALIAGCWLWREPGPSAGLPGRAPPAG
jgi:4'-phosphopantetheinyl transferase